MGWARADGELRAEPPWDRIDRNRGAGRLARRGVRHETRDASGDMRPRDVRQVAAFSPPGLTPCPPPGPTRQGRRAGPKGAASRPRAESTGIARASIPRSSGARSSPSRWSWWSRWSRAATRLEPPLKGSGREAPDMCLAAADLVATLAHFASPPEPERDHRDHQDNRDGAGGPRRPIRSP